jgi:hypothetical protein
VTQVADLFDLLSLTHGLTIPKASDVKELEDLR